MKLRIFLIACVFISLLTGCSNKMGCFLCNGCAQQPPPYQGCSGCYQPIPRTYEQICDSCQPWQQRCLCDMRPAPPRPQY